MPFLRQMVATVRHRKIQKIQIAYTTFSNQYSSGEKSPPWFNNSLRFYKCSYIKMCKAQIRAKRIKINWKPENAEKNFKQASRQWGYETKSLRGKDHQSFLYILWTILPRIKTEAAGVGENASMAIFLETVHILLTIISPQWQPITINYLLLWEHKNKWESELLLFQSANFSNLQISKFRITQHLQRC